MFQFEKMDIKGAYIIKLFYSEDKRGDFIKNYEKKFWEDRGIKFNCSESFLSDSKKNVVRGMHFQLYHPQMKLVNVAKGAIYDVIVDLRKESSTFGRWWGGKLSAEDRTALLIPRGCAHGFLSLEEGSIVHYLCDGKYHKETDTGILYNDLDIAIKWPIENIEDIIVGERDLKLMTFKEFRDTCQFIW